MIYDCGREVICTYIHIYVNRHGVKVKNYRENECAAEVSDFHCCYNKRPIKLIVLY